MQITEYLGADQRWAVGPATHPGLDHSTYPVLDHSTYPGLDAAFSLTEQTCVPERRHMPSVVGAVKGGGFVTCEDDDVSRKLLESLTHSRSTLSTPKNQSVLLSRKSTPIPAQPPLPQSSLRINTLGCEATAPPPPLAVAKDRLGSPVARGILLDNYAKARSGTGYFFVSDVIVAGLVTT